MNLNTLYYMVISVYPFFRNLLAKYLSRVATGQAEKNFLTFLNQILNFNLF